MASGDACILEVTDMRKLQTWHRVMPGEIRQIGAWCMDQCVRLQASFVIACVYMTTPDSCQHRMHITSCSSGPKTQPIACYIIREKAGSALTGGKNNVKHSLCLTDRKRYLMTTHTRQKKRTSTYVISIPANNLPCASSSLQYSLYLEDGKRFLMAARKRQRKRTSNYVISLDAEDLKRESEAFFGKLRSNFVGSDFTIYDAGTKPEAKKRGKKKDEDEEDEEEDDGMERQQLGGWPADALHVCCIVPLCGKGKESATAVPVCASLFNYKIASVAVEGGSGKGSCQGVSHAKDDCAKRYANDLIPGIGHSRFGGSRTRASMFNAYIAYKRGICVP
eukprot:1157289-Pelagomonas_calceolata.AAC.7